MPTSGSMVLHLATLGAGSSLHVLTARHARGLPAMCVARLILTTRPRWPADQRSVQG